MQLRARETDARDVVYLLLQLPLEEGVVDYATAVRKRKQLEREIRESNATMMQKSNLLHSTEKLWMFLAEFVPEDVKDAWMDRKD